jgi:hypothetical protein
MPSTRAAGIVGAVFGSLPDLAMRGSYEMWAFRLAAAAEALDALGGKW